MRASQWIGIFRSPKRLMAREIEMQPKVQRTASTVIGAIGLALVVMMITTEGEPGALPLGLMLIGAVGYVTSLMRAKDAPPK